MGHVFAFMFIFFELSVLKFSSFYFYSFMVFQFFFYLPSVEFFASNARLCISDIQSLHDWLDLLSGS